MDHDWLIGATRGVAALLCFRSLPVLFWALLATDVRLVARVGLAGALLISLTVARRFGLFDVGWLAGAYGYYVAVAACMPAVSRMVRDGLLTRGAVFALCTGAFLVLPSIVLPHSENATALVVGWDLVLSSYSYVVETSKKTEERSLKECLFFLLVNPALVFTRCGHKVAEQRIELRGLARVIIGLATLFVAFAVAGPAIAALEARFERGAARVVASAAVVLLLFLFTYARHSGLASVQIGMIRQLGYVVPERYELPILAKNPLEFWRRWNTYVGTWMLHYIFWPLSLTVGRRRGTRRAQFAQAVALLATFAAVGLLHDEQRYLRTLDGHFRGLIAFSAAGLLVAVYAGVVAAARTVEWSAPKWLSDLMGRSVLWTVTLALFAWWTG